MELWQTWTSGKVCHVDLNVPVSGGDTLPSAKKGVVWKDLTLLFGQETNRVKTPQCSFAYSGPVEAGPWTQKACWCYPWKLLCCSPYIPTSFLADTNRLPHNTTSTIQQENSSSLSLTTGGLSSLLQGIAVGWENICELMPWFHPPSLLVVLWLPPSFQPLLHTHFGASSSMPWEMLRPPREWCGDPVQCPGLVQPQSLKGGWSQLSSHRMSQCKAWALLLGDTEASPPSKTGERFMKNYSIDNY